MTKKQKSIIVNNYLKKLYIDPKCSLIASKPYELLMATRLSAQCLDSRVNIVTKVLFSKYTTLKDIASANIFDVENIIKSCGFYRRKAEDIIGIANMLIEKYNGIVPDTIEELTTLPGVGRKTANLIIGDVYSKSAVVVDTHCIRISNRLGLVNTTDPYKIELALKKLLPPVESNNFCHRLVLFGREICNARSPKCIICELKEICLFKK